MLRTLVCLLLCPATWAADFTVGSPPPDLAIHTLGELVIEDDDFVYTPWTLPGGLGEVHVIQYMAGRMSARGQTKPFTDKLEASFPDKGIHVTSVVNLDDAIWGTTGFVISEVKSNKRKYPESTIVLDKEGTGLNAWGLTPRVATTLVIDPAGAVQYVKEGAMSEEEIDSALELIRSYITP